MRQQLTATEADERQWCNYCPDLILPGEIVATGEGFTNPFGEQGFAHADCARRKGHAIAEDREPIEEEAALRQAFREHGVTVDALNIETEA